MTPYASKSAMSLFLQKVRTKSGWKYFKVEQILKGSLNSISSPSFSVKTQIMGKNVCLRCKGKTLLGTVNKLFAKKFVDSAQQCFAEKNKNKKFKCSRLLEGDEIEYRLPFKIFSTLRSQHFKNQLHLSYLRLDCFQRVSNCFLFLFQPLDFLVQIQDRLGKFGIMNVNVLIRI